MQFIDGADELCLRCGHCIAACPVDAVRIDGLNEAMFSKLDSEQIGYDELQRFMLARRSVRNFSDQPVAQDMVNQMVKSISTAPTGLGIVSANVCIINGREKIEPMIGPMVEFYRKFMRGMGNGIGRTIMRLMMGKDLFTALRDFTPVIKRMLDYYDETGVEPITWGAPLLMLFHVPQTVLGGSQDAVISCTYAMLAAHAMGLGTTMIGMVPPYINKNAKEKERLGIPAENNVELSLIVGHPKERFVKGIQRTVPVQQI